MKWELMKRCFNTTLQTENNNIYIYITTVGDKLCNFSSVDRKLWPHLLRFLNIIHLTTIYSHIHETRSAIEGY